ncbi:hypothetical protein LSAT2_025985, partial [Lamellibrachia satsuma]
KLMYHLPTMDCLCFLDDVLHKQTQKCTMCCNTTIHFITRKIVALKT